MNVVPEKRAIESEFLLREYEHLWAVVEAREAAVRQLFTASLTVGIPLLTLVAGFVLGGGQYPPDLAYLFLAPVVLIIPLFALQAAHRYELLRAGNYIRVFYDADGLGTAWASRLDSFRKIRGGEALNSIPLTYWTLFVVCSGAFLWTLRRYGAVPAWQEWLVIVSLGLALGITHHRFSFRDGCAGKDLFTAWQSVRSLERTNESSTGKASSDG